MARVQSKNEQIEQGDVYFLYRPEVGEEKVGGSKDVQRFYLLLHPRQGQKYRLIVVGRKEMPGSEDHERYWAFVDRVFESSDAMRNEIGEQRYRTKTRGERKVPAMRPAAEGVYTIMPHEDHVHLAYMLELPERRGEVGRDLNIETKASYILAVKNPEKGGPQKAGLSSKQKAEYPKKIRSRFRGRRFAPLGTSEFLDHEGAELMLIGASGEPEKELGIRFEPDKENEYTADVFTDLKLPKRSSRKPLFKGEWE